MDGFEVLAAIRAETLPIRATLLLPRQKEHEILFALTLGAEDFLVQPYSPVELAARLKSCCPDRASYFLAFLFSFKAAFSALAAE